MVIYIFQFENIKKKRELEEKKRFPLEKRLKEKIVGQENAIKVVASGNLVHILFLFIVSCVVITNGPKLWLSNY